MVGLLLTLPGIDVGAVDTTQRTEELIQPALTWFSHMENVGPKFLGINLNQIICYDIFSQRHWIIFCIA